MMLLARHARHLCVLRPIAMAVVLVLTVTHPLFHGTPIDGGALDSLLTNLQWFVYSNGSEE